MAGGRMRSQAGCGACGTGRTTVKLSQGERAEGFPELREQTTLPSAAGRAWPPPHPAEPPADFRSQSHALSEEQAPEG